MIDYIYSFPKELIVLIAEYNGIVEDISFALLDKVEEKIYTEYDLVLKK